MKRSRQQAERLGHQAEWIALWFLRAKGYHLVARRYRTPAGEIDLIMRKGNTTAFIEVKARASIDHGILAVGNAQSRRIAAAAALFTARNNKAAQSFQRFDIVAVPAYLWPTHIKNAFEGLR